MVSGSVSAFHLFGRGPPPASSVVHLPSGMCFDAATLRREIARRAALLEAMGAGPRSRVAICHGGTPHFFADLFATWRLGACAVPLNPGLTAPELRVIDDFAQPIVFLTDDAGPPLAGLRAPVRCLSADSDEERDAASTAVADLPADAPALILFTSGTTGHPKGVELSFAALGARVSLNLQAIGAPALARSLCPLATHFGHGLIGNCLTPLYAGGTLFLLSSPSLAAIGRLGATIDEHAITFLSSVPSLWKIAAKASPPPAGGSLRRVHIGSAPLSALVWRNVARWAGEAEVVNMYGITETANWIAGASSRGIEPADGLVGRMWGGSARTMAAASEEESDEGELSVRTPSLMSGYFQRPDLTQTVIRQGWFHTGDIGRIDAQGMIHLTGRAKLEINRAGTKVHPEEVELVLESLDSVGEACVFGVPDEVSGEIVAAAVRLLPGAREDGAGLRARLSARMRRECIPERWFFVDEIPRNDRGKVDRRAMLARFSPPRRGGAGDSDMDAKDATSV